MRVDPGACKFITDIEVSSEDGMTFEVNIESNCPNVKKLSEDIREIQLFDAIATPITENEIFIKSGVHLAHAACPMPVALVKICEAAGALALKKEVCMRFE